MVNGRPNGGVLPPVRLRTLYSTRDLALQVSDRLGLDEAAPTTIKDPIIIKPELSYMIDADQLCKDNVYEDISIAYTAGVGLKKVFEVPDGEIAFDVMLFAVNSGDAGRTIDALYVCEDSTLANYVDLISQVAGQQINWTPQVSTWQALTLYAGEVIAANYAANAAGGTMTAKLRYTRLYVKAA